MRKAVIPLAFCLLGSSCASVQEVKSVREISKIPVDKKNYFGIGKVNPFTPPELLLKDKQVVVQVVDTPLPVVMKGICQKTKINCDEKSWEGVAVPVTVNFKGNLYNFLKLLQEKYSLKFSYAGKVLRLYDYDQFSVEKEEDEFYSELLKESLPKVSVSFNGESLSRVLSVLTMVSGWEITTDDTINPEKVDKEFTFSAKNVSLKTVLDAVKNTYGYTYRINPEEKQVIFSAMVTKVYRIPLLAKTTKVSYTVAVKSSDGDSKVSKEVTVVESFWNTLRRDLKRYISKDGKLFISPETGIVSVTDRPSVIRRIDRVMENAVREALSQVSFRVAIYEVTLNRDVATGIDWSSIFKGAKVHFSASGATSYVLNWSGTGSLAGNPFSYLVKALENYGKVRVLYDNYVKTKSGEQVSIYPTTDYRYVSKVTVNYLDNGQIAAEPEFDSMTLGLQVSLIPKRINDEEVSFDVTVANTSLVSEETYTFGGNTFTNPKLVSNNKVSFSSILRRGQLEVLTGWKGYRIEDNDSGIPYVAEIPGVGLAFKGKSHKAKIVEFVVAIYVY